MPAAATKLGEDMLALALHECQAIRRALEDRDDACESIHEARKAIRRLRSLLALATDFIDGLDAVDRSLDRLAKGLSTLRDAHVAVVVARKLADGDESSPWQAVSNALATSSDSLLAQELARDPGLAHRRRTVARIERTLKGLSWTALGVKDLRSALMRSQKRASKARACAEDDPSPENIHRWRRRTRRLRMQLEAMQTIAPGMAKAVARPSLGKQLKALYKLADELGWSQDLQVLRALLRAMKQAPDRSLLLNQLQARIEDAGRRLL